MSTPQTSSTSVLRAAEVLDLTIAQASQAARHDLVRRLSDARGLLVGTAGQASLCAVTHLALSALDQLIEMLRFRQSVLVRPGRADQARTDVRLAEERLDSLEGRSARWQTLLYDSFAAIHSDVGFDLHRRMHTVLADAEHTLDHGDPAKNFDELSTWLCQRLADEARANHDLTVTSARTVSVRAAQHFALGEMHIIDPPPARIPTDLPTTLTTDHVMSGTRTGLTSGMNIFLRTYIGFVMFFLLTGFTGVMLPFALGLAPAVLMGGLAIIEERKRQIGQRQAQAATTIRNYVNDFSTRVAKDSRDLLRQLEQQLRDAYTAHVEQAQRTLQEARHVALRTLDEHEQAPTLLAQLDTDLALLADLHGRAIAIISTELPGAPHTKPHRGAPRGEHYRTAEPAPMCEPIIQPGTRIADFVVDALVGTGGMGEVYRAQQVGVDRPVALKVLAPPLAADAEFVRRFRQEATTMRDLEHPGILGVYAAGEDGGLVYLAMRLVNGPSLAQVLADRGPMISQALPVLKSLATALDYAHSRGVIHRDIKPANVLLDADGRPFLADFGISEKLDQAAHTVTGECLGTPRYMAPEQADGARVSRRADLYSLGCVAFEMLTGQVPFTEPDTIPLLVAHATKPVPWASKINPKLPVAVDAVFIRALAKVPTDRFASAAAFVDALRAALGTQPPVDVPARRRALLGSAAVA